MKNINRLEKIAGAAIEGGLVFMGVLLAFYFDGMADDRERQELLRRDLKLLSLELTETTR